MNDMLNDLRFATRSLLRAPAFSAAAVGTAALGVALVTAMVVIVNAYLIRPMPYPHADRLYHVSYAPPGEREPGGMASLDWRALGGVVERADNSAPTRMYVGAGADRQEAMGLQVAPGSLEMLGVRAAPGRSLSDDDFRAGAEPVVLIGRQLWRERFGADPAIVGRTLPMSRPSEPERSESYRIIGVLPADFRFAGAYDRGAIEFVLPQRGPATSYLVRLRAGVSTADARQQIDAAVVRAATSMPADWRGVRLESIHTRYVASVRPLLLAIAVAAAIVLVIVCGNMAVLMLLRALRRQKEVAIRLALGAGRGQLLRLLLTESVLVCGAALVAGTLMSALALRALAPIIEERLGRAAPGGTAAIAIDGTVLLIVIGAGVAIALLQSLFPLLSTWRGSLADTLRRSTGASDRGGARVRRALVALEVAASLTLLVGCGLMIRTVLNLAGTDLGYRTEHVARARLALPAGSYPDAASFLRFYDELDARLAAYDAPFALTNAIPFYEYPQLPIEVDDAALGNMDAGVIAVSERYFAVLDIGVREGRGFTALDRPEGEPVVIVSRTLARRLAPGGSALGRRIRTPEQDDRQAAAAWRTIVGVANDVRQTHTDSDLDDVYIPFAQAPTRYAPIYVRTEQPASVWLGFLRASAAAIDPNVLVSVAVTGSSALSDGAQQLLAPPRFLMSLLTGFAAFATLLALLGIFGVTAYAVEQRRRELAIRSAIGATRGRLIALFVKDCASLLAAGVALGGLGAAALGRSLRHQLHGVQPLDPATLLLAGALLAGAGLLASWWPAARGGALDHPMTRLNDGG